jgi:hypothetical protein
MNTDEKNKISSNSSEVDQAKIDREYQKGHKRITDDKIEPDVRKGPHHDPHNIKNKDINLHKPVHKPFDEHGLDLNREESPTNEQVHHVCNPDAKIKKHKDKPHKVCHDKKVDVTSNQTKTIKHDYKQTEILHNKQSEFPNSNKHTNKHHQN